MMRAIRQRQRRNNPSLVREGVYFFCPWIQAKLISNDEQGSELFIRYVAAFERCVLQRIHQVGARVHSRRSASFPAIVVNAVVIMPPF